MQSTHVQTVEVIAGVEPLRLRYSMFNQRYLIKVFSSESHPLKQKLCELHSLGSPKILREFTIVSALDICSNMQIYNYPLDALLYSPVVDAEIRRELMEVSKDVINWWLLDYSFLYNFKIRSRVNFVYRWVVV
jgi:hypothetical protein